MLCVSALEQTEDVSIPVGGPEVLTREDIVRLAFETAGTDRLGDYFKKRPAYDGADPGAAVHGRSHDARSSA